MKYTYRQDSLYPSTIYYWARPFPNTYACNESWRSYDYCFGFNHE